MKLRFSPADRNSFGEDLRRTCARYCSRYDIAAGARRLLWIKLAFYSLLFLGTYTALLTVHPSAFAWLALQYILLGLCGVLLAFNAAHDAAHSTFSQSRRMNSVIFTLTFNLQGLSGYLWRIRHLASHHVFPNVDGCDADIDDNPFLLLSPQHRRRPWHRYQHLYATGLYAVYTLHWFLVKDVLYLLKKDLANLRSQRHSRRAVLQLVGWKVFYLVYMLIIPAAVTGVSFYWITGAFLIMHACISLFFVWTLIISHLCCETEFPVADASGSLPHDFYYHQLAVSMDYHPRSRLANWIFGGFNAHAAHHLFPRLPHTCYPALSKLIKRHCERHGYPYHAMSMPAAIASHYRYLGILGRGA